MRKPAVAAGGGCGGWGRVALIALSERRPSQNCYRIRMIQQRFLHLQPMAVAALPCGVAGPQTAEQLIRQGRLGQGVKKQRFCGNAFGVDDMVAVKQQLKIVDKAAVLHHDCVTVDQIPRSHQQLGAAGAQLVMAL